jgi:hypothetical protein
VFLKDGDSALSLEQLKSGLSCSFDKEDMCMWTNDLARSFDEWMVNKLEFQGLTETQYFFKKIVENFKTGPQNTDFNGKKSQRYIYMNSLRKTSDNANGILTSPKIKVAVPTKVCLKYKHSRE